MAPGKSAGISPKQNYSGGTTPIQDDKIPTEEAPLKISAQPPKAKRTGKQPTVRESLQSQKQDLILGQSGSSWESRNHLEYLKETGHLMQGAGFGDDGRGKS